MKTLIIFNYETPKYLIVDGDYSKFNNIRFNGFNITSDLEKECDEWLWDKHGILKYKFSDEISIIENKQWDKVAVITYIPQRTR